MTTATDTSKPSHKTETTIMKHTKKLFAMLMMACLAMVAVALVNAPATAYAGDKGTIAGKLTGKKKYLKQAVVYLEGVTTKAPSKAVKYDQKNQKFRPHVIAVVKGTTVAFLNSDATGHNVYSPDHEKYDLGTWKKGETRDYKFKKLGAYTQLCKLHPSMLGYIVSVPNKYFAKTDKSGKFKIKNVPPGKYTLKVWQAKGKGASVKVTVKAGATAKVKVKMKKN
jgi:plastocyanin